MPAIAENRRARFEYHIDERHEAGIVLQGWEVKAIRAGQVQLTDGYVVIRDGELHLIGLHSDGNVHSHTDHLYAIVHRAAIQGVTRCRLHILLDRGSAEVFADRGRVAISVGVIPADDNRRIELIGQTAPAALHSVTVYPLESAWKK